MLVQKKIALIIMYVLISMPAKSQIARLQTEKPNKDIVFKALDDFEWDNTNKTNKNEAFRLLTFLGANYEHYQEYKSGEGYMCGKLPSGYYLTIFTDSFGKKNKYHVRYGLDKNHSYFSTQAYSNETTYDIDKKTNPDYVAHYLLTDASNFKEDSSLGTLFGPIHALNYMVLNPPELLSVEARTNLLGGIIWEIDNTHTFSFYVPVTLSEIDENTGFKPRDMIVGVIDKKKLDKIQLDNKKRKLDKAKKPLELIIFRQGQFLKKTWNPNTQYRYYTNSGFKNIVRDFRYDLVKMVLESGPVDLKLNAKKIVGGNAFSNRGHPLIGVIRNPKTYSKRILDILVKYGADVNMTDHWGNTPLHVAAGAFYHTGCSYYEHKKINDKSGAYGLRGSEEAYFHLIELGAKDDAEGPYRNSLKCSTPKQYYFLTFKNKEHKIRPKDFDWNTLANAVITGTGAALQEKQRQVNETNTINQINQDYQNQVNQRIEKQKQHVAQSNAEYLNRTLNSSQTVNNTTSTSTSQNQVQTSKNDDVPGYNYTNNVNLNAGNAPNGHSQDNNAIVLSAQQPIEKIKQLDNSFTSYSIGEGELPDSPYLRPIGETRTYANTTSTVVGYRNAYRPKLKKGGNPKIPADWYIETWKHEVWENTTKNTDIEFMKKQVQNDKRQFFTISKALNAPIDNAQGAMVFWSKEAAQNWINERLNDNVNRQQ